MKIINEKRGFVRWQHFLSNCLNKMKRKFSQLYVYLLTLVPYLFFENCQMVWLCKFFKHLIQFFSQVGIFLSPFLIRASAEATIISQKKSWDKIRKKIYPLLLYICDNNACTEIFLLLFIYFFFFDNIKTLFIFLRVKMWSCYHTVENYMESDSLHLPFILCLLIPIEQANERESPLTLNDDFTSNLFFWWCP